MLLEGQGTLHCLQRGTWKSNGACVSLFDLQVKALEKAQAVMLRTHGALEATKRATAAEEGQRQAQEAQRRAEEAQHKAEEAQHKAEAQYNADRKSWEEMLSSHKWDEAPQRAEPYKDDARICAKCNVLCSELAAVQQLLEESETVQRDVRLELFMERSKRIFAEESMNHGPQQVGPQRCTPVPAEAVTTRAAQQPGQLSNAAGARRNSINVYIPACTTPECTYAAPSKASRRKSISGPPPPSCASGGLGKGSKGTTKVRRVASGAPQTFDRARRKSVADTFRKYEKQQFQMEKDLRC